MPTLLLVNGLPGVGKSRAAREASAARPPTLALDVDEVRAMLGGWRADPAAAGTAARRLATAMARAHLDAGFDVLVPQFVARPEFVVTLARTAAEAGARFVHALLDAPDDVLAARLRSRGEGGGTDRDNAALLAAEGGVAALPRLRARLAPVATDAVRIDATGGDASGVLLRLLG